MLTVQAAGWAAFVLGATGLASLVVGEAFRHHRRGVRLSRVATLEEDHLLDDTASREGRPGVAKGSRRSPRPRPAVPAPAEEPILRNA